MKSTTNYGRRVKGMPLQTAWHEGLPEKENKMIAKYGCYFLSLVCACKLAIEKEQKQCIDVSRLIASMYRNLVSNSYMKEDCYILAPSRAGESIYNKISKEIGANKEASFTMKREKLKIENKSFMLQFKDDDMVIAHYHYAKDKIDYNHFVLLDNSKYLFIDHKTNEVSGTVLYCGLDNKSVSVNKGGIVSLRLFNYEA